MPAGTPFILQDRLGFSPREFGLIVLVSIAGFAAGNFANNRLVGRVSGRRYPALGRQVSCSWCDHHGRAFAVGRRDLVGDRATAHGAELRPGMIGRNASAGAVGCIRGSPARCRLVGLAQMGMARWHDRRRRADGDRQPRHRDAAGGRRRRRVATVIALAACSRSTPSRDDLVGVKMPRSISARHVGDLLCGRGTHHHRQADRLAGLAIARCCID